MRLLEFRGMFFATGVVEIVKTTANEFVEEVFAGFKNVQLVKPEIVMDWDVFDAAIVTAMLAFGSQKQKAKTLANEVLLRLAATTQIEDAIAKAGLSPNSREALYVVVADNPEDAAAQASKIVEAAGGVEKGLADNPDIEKIVEAYGIKREQLAAVQAKTEKEAVKLLIIQKMSATMI
ncbi:MAG: KEOPS complex subunit Cgi121 [Candidatus Caldarchaeum sp.]|nr:KEOPS complex subunit Cgi121 [Candidatus Caldarchaeum sp.]